MAPGAIPTIPAYLKEWLPGKETYIKNCSCMLSQHGKNYIMLMSKYFSAKARPAAMALIHIFHHPWMLKNITLLDSLMSVDGNEWQLKDPDMGCHTFRTRKGSICLLVDCGCLFSNARMLCQHILKHYGHIWGCDKCWEYYSWDTGAAYDHWTSKDCSKWKGKLLLMEQEQEAKKGTIMCSIVEFNQAAKEDPACYHPFEAQCSIPLISAFATQDGKLHTLQEDKKALDVLFQKL